MVGVWLLGGIAGCGPGPEGAWEGWCAGEALVQTVWSADEEPIAWETALRLHDVPGGVVGELEVVGVVWYEEWEDGGDVWPVEGGWSAPHLALDVGDGVPVAEVDAVLTQAGARLEGVLWVQSEGRSPFPEDSATGASLGLVWRPSCEWWRAASDWARGW